MMKPVYDITPPDIDSIDWLQCRVVMEVSEHYFLYTILKGKESAVALKYYSFPEQSNHPFADEIYAIVKGDDLLQKRMSEHVVIYNLPENCFIPAEQFNADLNKSIIRLLHGDLTEGSILSERLEGEGVYNIFRVPADIHHFFVNHFPQGRFWHYFSTWMKSLRADEKSMIDLVSVIFYPNKLLVAVNKMGKFQMMQSLQYQTPEDVAYHLLNIYNHFGFSQEDMPLDVGGMVDVDSSLYEELLKYFQVIEKEKLPQGLELNENFQSFPEHFFSPLLKVALCVS
jgi:uncharacterized protein DUF3822